MRILNWYECIRLHGGEPSIVQPDWHKGLQLAKLVHRLEKISHPPSHFELSPRANRIDGPGGLSVWDEKHTLINPN